MKNIESGFSGVIPDLPNDEYHGSRALGSTDIKYASRSLAHFKTHIDGKTQFSKSTRESFDLGACAHEMILERSDHRFVVGPEVSSKATKAWKEFCEANPDKIVLSPDEYNRVINMYASLYSHPIAKELVSNSKVEQSYFCIDHNTGLWLKARPDGIGEDYIVDYKTTSSLATPREFSRTVANLGYDLSAAHYMDVVESVTKTRPKHFYFIVQEKKAPYQLMVYRATDIMLAGAKMVRDELLSRIQEATRTKCYPGYPMEIIELDIPAWAAEAQIDNLEVG